MTPTRLDVIFRDWELQELGKRQIWKGQNMTRSLVDNIDDYDPSVSRDRHRFSRDTQLVLSPGQGPKMR